MAVFWVKKDSLGNYKITDNVEYLILDKIKLDNLYDNRGAFEAWLSTPENINNPAGVFLNGNKEFIPISIGGGGYAAPLYFTTIDSIVDSYHQLNYSYQETEYIIERVLPQGETLLQSYIYDGNIDISSIPAGSWIFSFYSKVTQTAGTTLLRLKIYSRDIDNVETLLFSADSTPINNTNEFAYFRFQVTEPVFPVNITDRLVIKLYGYCSLGINQTIYTKVGGVNSAYVTTPLEIRHNSLRDLNGNPNYQHITTTEKALLHSRNTDTEIVSPDGNTTVAYTDNNGNLYITGDIILQGEVYETTAEHLYINDALIYTRANATVALNEGEYTGIEAILYDGTNNGRLVFDRNGIARVGDTGEEQPLATREEYPIDSGLAEWDNTTFKFITISKTSLPISTATQSALDLKWSFSGNILGAKKTLGSIDNQDFGIVTNNTEKLTVLKGGNVGIGTRNPNQQLEITKNFRLPATVGTDAYGVIYKDDDRFIHDFNYGNNGTVTTTGQNTFIGINAGNFTMGSTATSASEASYNTGIGASTLFSNTTGSYNSAIGLQALQNNTTGSSNSAIGVNAGRYLLDGTTGRETGNNGLYLGYDSKASANGTNNEIVIGADAIGKGSNTATIGNSSLLRTYMTGVNLKAGTAIAGTAPLKFTSGTNLGTPEAGAIEYDGSNLYFTPSNTRYKILLDNSTSDKLLSGDGTPITIGNNLTLVDGVLAASGGNTHDPITLGIDQNGLSLNGQILSLAKADKTTTGAIHSEDFSIFAMRKLVSLAYIDALHALSVVSETWVSTGLVSQTGTYVYIPLVSVSETFGMLTKSEYDTFNSKQSNLLSSTNIELGGSLTGNRNSYIDFHGDDTYTDYGLRIIRNNTGENAGSGIYHRGTGELAISALDAANINLYTSNISRFNIAANGDTTLNGYTAINGTPNTVDRLYVVGNIHSTSLEVGRTSGSISLTTNDGYGNANIGFNHKRGIPDKSGSSGRIVCSVDSTTSSMTFQLADNTSIDVPIALAPILTLNSNKLYTSTNLGINNSNPSCALDVTGAIKQSNVTSSIVKASSSGVLIAATTDDLIPSSQTATFASSFTIDWGNYKTVEYLTLTGACSLVIGTIKNYVKRIFITGNYTLTIPSISVESITGDNYDGTIINCIDFIPNPINSTVWINITNQGV